MKTLALLGVGRWGKNILSTLEKIPEANLKYLCARDRGSLSSYEGKYQTVSDWRALLQKEDLDAVLIATPPSTHGALIASALRAGKDVFVEKPMVLSSAEAKRIQKLVASTNKVFMVGYQYLFHNGIRRIKKEIESGSLGQILEVQSEHAVSPSRPDVDIFWDVGSHPLSVFQYVFNPHQLISAEGTIEHDIAQVRVTFADAPMFVIFASCFGAVKTRKVTVLGEKATAVLDETLEKNTLAIVQNGNILYPAINSRKPLQNEMEHFIHCLHTGETPLTGVDFGCQITEWLETISNRIGRGR
jgi:predicted dehydrogenase